MTETPSLPVICNSESSYKSAAALAHKLQQPLLLNVDPQTITDSDFVLQCDERGVALQQTGRKAPGAISAEFTQGAVDHRRKFGGGKGQMIAKAVGVKSGVYPRVLDATAGLGKDAFVLATLGCRMQLIERSPVVHALLEDGLCRARDFAEAEDADLLDTLSRMDLLALDSRNYLQTIKADEYPDVIYLDPMFPDRQKTADVKKEMRAFHSLVGKDEDAADLLDLALNRAHYRVVVKRPRKSPTLNQKTPSYQLEGKSSRYDIYALKKMPDKLPG